MKKKSNLYFSSSTRDEKAKKKIDPMIIRFVVVVATVLILSLMFAVILGNVLQKKADEIKAPETETDEMPLTITAAPKAQALNVQLSNVDLVVDSNLTVSITARNHQGVLLYSSPVAQSIGLQKEGEKSSLNEAVSLMHERGNRVSVVFYSTAFRFETKEIQKTMLQIELAYLMEIASWDVDEIVIFGMPTDADSSKDVAEYIQTIKKNAPNTLIGMAIPFADVYPDLNQDLLQMYQYTDFLALDLHGCSTEKDKYQDDGNGDFVLVENPIHPTKIYERSLTTITLYGMRVMIDMQQKEVLTIIQSDGCQNWQTYAAYDE